MTTNVSEEALREESLRTRGGGQPEEGQTAPTYAYYRQPNGWITVSPCGDMDELKYRREGWEPLHQYGRFEMATEYAADHPLELLFIGGGAFELPYEQVIGQALHLNPPLIPSCSQTLGKSHRHHTGACWAGARAVRFPQLRGDEQPFPCRFCDREDLPTEAARAQHEGVAHKEEKSDIRTGETLAASLIKGFGGQAPSLPSLTTAPLPYVCGFCGHGEKSPVGLGKHVKLVHKSVENDDGD